jgi:AcrR family transcriptional regulator
MAQPSLATTGRQEPDRHAPLDEPVSDERRRGRKKRQTRDALIDAALDLFAAQGYERTAVHEITDLVDVAERTFYRHFANKEDLALFFVKQERDYFVRALAARPLDEGPLLAVRNAFRLTLEQLGADTQERHGEPRYLAIVRLIDSTPALLAATMRYAYDNSEASVKVLAEREGLDPATDRRPWLLMAVYAAIVALVHHDWRMAGRGDVGSMLASFDAYADQLRPTVAGRWRSGPTGKEVPRPGDSLGGRC